MSKALPATFDTARPDQAASGQAVDVDHVAAALNNQTWCEAYRGCRVHLTKQWGAAAVRETGAALVAHLEFDVAPTRDKTRLYVMAACDSDAASNTVRISDGVTNLDLTFGSGYNVVTGTLTGLTAAALNTITVSLARGGTATYLDLLRLTVEDDELALGDLP